MASFLQTLFAFLFNSGSPEAIKKRTIKALARRIRSNRNGKFYRPKAKELTPVCGRFFHGIYKTVSIAQVTMPDLVKSTALRNLIIENFIDKRILDRFNRLSAESIAERNKGANPRHLTEELRNEFDALTVAIGMAAEVQIDSCYNLILSLGQFVSFDYYALLKRFGFKDREHSFNAVPKFTHTKVDMVINMFQDFADYIAVVDTSQDWKTALRLLNAARNGGDIIGAEQWYKVLFQLQEIQHSGILLLIIQHATENLAWQIRPQIPSERIFSKWLDTRQQIMEDEITKITTVRWVNQIRELTQVIFGDTAVNPLKYYNERISEMFIAKGFEGFIHTAGLSYLMAFLQQVYVKEIQELCDLLTIQAQWAVSSQFLSFSEEGHVIQALMSRLDDFDESLRNDGMNGALLVTALTRLDRDRSQGKFIKELLNEINKEAMDILMQTTDSLTTIAGNMEAAKNDYFQDFPTLIVNWRGLEVASHRNMSAWLKTMSEKLEKFIELARLFIEQ